MGRVLIEHGAKVNYCGMPGRDFSTNSPLIISVTYGLSHWVELLLASPDIDLGSAGNAGVLYACICARHSNSEDIAALLINAGCHIHIKGINNYSPAMNHVFHKFKCLL